VFRCNNVDVVDIANFLKLQVPFTEFFRCEIHAISLVANVKVLTKDASEVAAAHKNRATTVVALDAWL
jgi:hypothetical protein